MTSQLAGQLEGILHIPDERQDGQLRDPLFPLRPVRGGIIVPRQLIRERRFDATTFSRCESVWR